VTQHRHTQPWGKLVPDLSRRPSAMCGDVSRPITVMVRSADMRPARFVSIAAGALLLLSLTACSGRGCSTGADNATDAVKSLIEAARSADSPQDVCRYVEEAWVVDDSDVQALKSKYSDEPAGSLKFTLSDQMGTDAWVNVKSTDGLIDETYVVSTDFDSKWTVAKVGILEE
jgi:hypothetical protein